MLNRGAIVQAVKPAQGKSVHLCKDRKPAAPPRAATQVNSVKSEVLKMHSLQVISQNDFCNLHMHWLQLLADAAPSAPSPFAGAASASDATELLTQACLPLG
jgi:hypothetical protein